MNSKNQWLGKNLNEVGELTLPNFETSDNSVVVQVGSTRVRDIQLSRIVERPWLKPHTQSLLTRMSR